MQSFEPQDCFPIGSSLDCDRKTYIKSV
jgi:hypothetical protein